MNWVTLPDSQVIPLKHVAGINERVLSADTDSDFEFRYVDISAVGHGSLVAEPELIRFGDAPSRARRLVGMGDTIISTVRTYLRAVWPVNGPTDDLVVSTGFAVLTPRRVDPRYFSWWLRSDAFIEEVVARSVGVSYPAINALDLGDLPVRVPPREEQRAIADYLDRETTRIDALRTRKRRLIALLGEREKRLVDDIFGSGEGRPLVRVGYLTTVNGGLTLGGKSEPLPDDVTLPYLRVANVQHGRLDLSEVKEVTVSAATAMRCRLRRGDVLMTEGGDIDKLGRGTVWSGEIEDCLHQNHVFAVRTDPSRLLPEYLAAVTRTSHARRYFEMTGVQSTNLASTSASKVRDFRIPLPSLSRQDAALREFSDRLAPVRRVVVAVSEQLELFTEPRQALITAAVTGELEVAA